MKNACSFIFTLPIYFTVWCLATGIALPYPFMWGTRFKAVLISCYNSDFYQINLDTNDFAVNCIWLILFNSNAILGIKNLHFRTLSLNQ